MSWQANNGSIPFLNLHEGKEFGVRDAIVVVIVTLGDGLRHLTLRPSAGAR